MAKFWEFEKSQLTEFFASQPDKNILESLSEKELEAVKNDLKYGSVEYLSNSLVFKPNKEKPKTLECQIFLGDEKPKEVLKV